MDSVTTVGTELREVEAVAVYPRYLTMITQLITSLWPEPHKDYVVRLRKFHKLRCVSIRHRIDGWALYRLPAAEARNTAILESESERIRAVQAALVAWVQAVANSTSRLIQTEAAIESSAGSALVEANATEDGRYSAADRDEQLDQQKLSLLRAEDKQVARARAQQEAELSGAIKGLDAGLSAKDEEDSVILSRMAKV